MAKRITLSVEVLDSDTFYNLSYMAQLTYFYVCMSCDKNGFTVRAKSTARAHLGTDEYIVELENAGFLIESNLTDFPGYVVIDWDKHIGKKVKL